MSALASSSTNRLSSNTGKQKEDHSTKTIPQLRSHLGLAVKSSKSKAAKGSKKQYFSKIELIELANSSNESTVIASKAPVEVIELANSSNESTVIASKAPVNVEDDNTKTSSNTTTKKEANDGLANLFQCKYDSILGNGSFDLFVKMNPTKEDIFKYMKNPIKLSDRKKIRKERGLKKKSEAMAFIANVNRIIEELSTAEALSEKDLWDDLLKTSEDFLKEQVEVKRKHDLETLGICSNCQIQKVHCKDCNDSHCAEESCDCFDDFIYKCGVCEESLCEHCDLLPKCGVCEGRYILNTFLQHNTITFFNFFFFFFCFCIFPIYFKERFCESCMEKDTCDGCNARCCESCGGFYRCGCCTKKYCNDCNPTWKYHGDTSMCKECFEEDGICDY